MRSVERLRRPASGPLLGPQATSNRPCAQGPPKWRAVVQGLQPSRPRGRSQARLSEPAAARAPAHGPADRDPLRGRRPAAGDLLRRPRQPDDGQRRADRDVGAALRRLGAVRRPPRCSAPAAARSRRSPPGSCSTCATCRWGSRSPRRCAARRGAGRPRAGDDRLLVGGGEPRRRALRPRFMLGATVPSYPCWVGGTVIGVFAGGLIGDPAALGLDVLFPAFFLCILVEGELRPGLPAVVAALGALIAFVLIPLHPRGRAGDRGHLRRLRSACAAAAGRSADDRRLDHDRGAHRDDRADPRVGPGGARRPRSAPRRSRA